MITEDYVSFEIAKLLKEKGFDEPCEGFYVNSGVLSHTLSNANNSKWDEEKYTIGYISAPTLQMAMKWLREVHKIYMYVAHDSMENTWFARVYNDYKILSDVDNHSTYEDACESAIKYCLEKLI